MLVNSCESKKYEIGYYPIRKSQLQNCGSIPLFAIKPIPAFPISAKEKSGRKARSSHFR
jgi:hypothetical protein